MSRGSGATVHPDPPDGDSRLREVGGAATWTVSTAKVRRKEGRREAGRCVLLSLLRAVCLQSARDGRET